MEICDVYDESGARTGKRATRGTPLPSGDYYLVVQVWIRNEAGEYLIQQRAAHLASSPGIWATTAGYVVANEDSIDGAIREVVEELGISLTPAQLRRFDRLKMPTRFEDIWMADVLRDALPLLIGPEVADCKWASKHEIRQMISRGDFFAYSYFDQLPE